MADTPTGEARPSVSEASPEPEPAKKPAAKKKTAKKKAASKKIVAKKGTTKKKAAKKKTASKITSTTSVIPSPAPAPSAPAPQWDDDQGGIGWIGLLVQWGPVLLLIALILVLDTHAGSDTHAAVDQSLMDAPGGEDVILTGMSSEGAIGLPDPFDPWSFGGLNDLTGDSGLGSGGTEGLPDTSMLEDPAAFYWGPAIVDEFPPAPGSDASQ